MLYLLKNNTLQVEIQAKGAELFSIKKKETQQEFLWQGDEAYWGRRAPVLFPFVGKLKNNSYLWQGQNYPMTQHGFARDLHFQLKEQSAQSLHLFSESTKETLAAYPFPFRLAISYTLQDNCITCTWEVTNTGETDMYFSIGAHPGFICPFEKNENLSDYFLEFNADESSPRNLLSDGLYNGLTAPVLQNPRTIILHEELFLQDAIVLKHIHSSSVTLKHRLKGSLIRMEFSGFPYLGIWKKPGAQFICLEPWHGLADTQTHNGDLKVKEGIIPLQPNRRFQTSYSIFVESHTP